MFKKGPSTVMQLSLSSADPGHVTSQAIKELILKHKIVIIYLHVISTEHKPKLWFLAKSRYFTSVNENLNVQYLRQ
jgi:hypothetical protein